MKIEHSIKKAIDELSNRDFECAMLHICNAIDGTAKKKNPALNKKSNNQCFTDFIRDHYKLLELMICPQLDFETIRWPIDVNHPKAPGGGADLADMIYGIHRCSHSHGEEIPEGFEIIPCLSEGKKEATFGIQKGSIQLSDHFLWALIAIVVFDSANSGLADPELDDYFFTLGGKKYNVNEWWGKQEQLPKIPEIKERIVLDFSELR